ncbi:MAG TPA: response regulator [Candidatus Acidoferrales bacterium]|nr:response regulator [Candidatus Acidoferrales bacterium]
MSETETLTAARIPNVYFIDDSATMREVIKIAFRKENIQVITCTDASSALAQFGDAAPDAVITDVIMPDKDGYQVCEFIKQHEQLAKIPVILMSGVVNRTVAERAIAVKADDLIRKPFQPQDLITRVKNLLHPKTVASQAGSDANNSDQHAARVLNNLFAATPTPFGVATPSLPRPEPPVVASAPRPGTPPASHPATPPRPLAASLAEIQKLRNEVRRLELLVKKLEAELQAEHQYCAALEAHFRLQQESE